MNPYVPFLIMVFLFVLREVWFQVHLREIAQERKRSLDERTHLMDRIMAVDYRTYQQLSAGSGEIDSLRRSDEIEAQLAGEE